MLAAGKMRKKSINKLLRKWKCEYLDVLQRRVFIAKGLCPYAADIQQENLIDMLKSIISI